MQRSYQQPYHRGGSTPPSHHLNRRGGGGGGHQRSTPQNLDSHRQGGLSHRPYQNARGGGGGAAGFNRHQPSASGGGWADRRPTNGSEAQRLLRHLNSVISRLGDDKKLGEAVQTFRKIGELGMSPSIVSYTALINAFVRSKETGKALTVFEALQEVPEKASERISKGLLWCVPKKQLSPNIVTYTTVIKALCNDGLLEKAWDLLIPLFSSNQTEVANESTAAKKKTATGSASIPAVESSTSYPYPNARCINTFLRGCVRLGDVMSAATLFELCRARSPSPQQLSELIDENSIAALVKLLCYAQAVDDAVRVVDFYRDKIKRKTDVGFQDLAGHISACDLDACNITLDESEVEASPSQAKRRRISQQSDTSVPLSSQGPSSELASLNFTTAETESSDKSEAPLLPPEVYIDLGQALAIRGSIQKAENYLKEARMSLEQMESRTGNNDTLTTSLKRNASATTSVNNTPSQSAALFLGHRMREGRREIERVEQYLKSRIGEELGEGQSKKEKCGKGFDERFFFPAFFFEPGGGRVSQAKLLDAADNLKVGLRDQSCVIQALWGMMEVAQNVASTSDTKSGVSDNEGVRELFNFGLAYHLCRRAVGGSKKKVLREAITALRERMSEKGELNFAKLFDRNRPIKLEICSGAGEWVVAQAGSKMGNGGSGYNWVALELRFDRCYQCLSRIVSSGLKNVCVVGGDASAVLAEGSPRFGSHFVEEIYINFPEPPPYFDHPQHLLSAKFFTQLHRLLKLGGELFIVSDDIAYLTSLGFLLRRLNTQYRSKGKGGADVFEGFPPSFGNDLSYFDRFWAAGVKHQRGHLRFATVRG